MSTFLSLVLSLFAHPGVAIFWVLAGGITMYFVLHKNRAFLNWSLKSIEQAALAKASGN